MCGINGFTFTAPELLRNMHRATRHRGPDDEGFFEEPGISLAHNRLAIIDLSPGGHQPMQTPDGRYTIVFNGEIYNYRELRKQLEQEGESFTSQSDTEVLLRGFARHGKAFLLRLNGIFAFALWDRTESSLLLVRDPLGVKPLYYFIDAGRLVFSSELKALLVHPFARTIDCEALNAFMRLLYVPSPHTILQGVSKLAPGHLLSFHQGQVTIERWWTLKEGDPISSFDEAKDAVRASVSLALRRQLVSDRPLGVFLSGGIDSSLVLALMSREAQGPVKTFSAGYVSDVQSERYNADFDLAKKTADFFGAEHHGLMITAEDAMRAFERVAWHMDEPISNHIQSSTYLLAQYAKPEITVALGGDGGDELFGGYRRYWLSAQMDRYQQLPAWMRRLAQPVLARLLKDADRLDIPFGVERFLAFLGQKESMIRPLFAPGAFSSTASASFLAPWFSAKWKDLPNQFMAVDSQTWLSDESLARTDRMTMAHALEQRVPLLDLELVQLATRIPSRWKLHSRDQGKHVLIEAFRDILPPHVLHQEKRGWFSPTAKWLRGPMRSWAEQTLSADFAPGTDAFFDFEAVRHLLDEHVQGQTYALNELWALITFQWWYRTVFLSL